MPYYEYLGNISRCTMGTRLQYSAHRHREIELVLMRTGSSTAIIEGTPYTVNAGDALLIYPNQLHQYISHQPENYILLIIPANIYNDYIDRIEGHLPIFPIARGAALPDTMLRTLAEICLQVNAQEDYQQHKCLIGALLGAVLNLFTLKKAETNNSSLEKILMYCDRHYTENITINQMAKELPMGKYYISHLFKKQIGIGLNDYINTLRIEAAQKLLITTEFSITEIAFNAGFSCPRTFNRVFYKQLGMSPREYRKKYRRDAI